MIYPPFLQKDSVIGVTAPSLRVTAPEDRRRFDNAVRMLGDKGLRVSFTESVFSDDVETSPSEVRIAELSELIYDPEVVMISLAKGGYGESDIVQDFDWSMIRNNPKWIQGYSDNTIIVFKTTVDEDVATIYGSNFGDYGMSPWHASVTENIEILFGQRTEQHSFPYHETGFHDRIIGNEPFVNDAPTVVSSAPEDVSFSGRLIGGCMDVLKWFADTGAANVPDFIDRYPMDNFIWYMETYDLPYEGMKDLFEKMESEGWLRRVSGFIFGRPFNYPGPDYREDVTSLLSGYDVPTVFDADIGHLAPRMTIINGAYAEFTVSGGNGSIRYSFV